MVSLICVILKNYGMNLFTRQKQTHRPRKQTMVTKGEREGGSAGSVRTLGVTYINQYRKNS